jgi:hypothetical protein
MPDGTFARHNKLGKGNPSFRRMQELRKSLLDAADPGTLQNLFRRLAELGMAGDTQAARLYIEHCVGKPTQSLALTGPDGEPFGVSITQLQAVMLEAVRDIPDAAVRLSHALRALAHNAETPAHDAHDATD